MSTDLAALRHHGAPRRIVFPDEAEMPETKRHLNLRTALYQVLLAAVAPDGSVGSEQFVYWNARDPSRTLAPDAFVKLGAPDDEFRSWKTWERGTPELAVEILSESDDRSTWSEKLTRYHELGVSELVAFDADAPAGQRLRVWDRVEDDFLEREVSGDATPCATLGLYWTVRSDGEGPALVLARDAAGTDVVLSRADAARVDAERKLAAALAELERLRGPTR